MPACEVELDWSIGAIWTVAFSYATNYIGLTYVL